MVTDEEEKEVMLAIFEFAREIISLQLTETELALLSALVLINPSKHIHVFVFMSVFID